MKAIFRFTMLLAVAAWLTTGLAAAAPAGKGRLTVRANGIAQVYLNLRLKATLKPDQAKTWSLAEGSYLVEIKNEEGKEVLERRVQIRAGKEELVQVEVNPKPAVCYQRSKPMRILDSGQLYSTYSLTAGDRLELLKQGLTDPQIDLVAQYSYETSWPEGIATLDARNTVRPYLNDYKCFLTGWLTLNNKVVVAIPAADNRHMPADMQPELTIYMVMGEDAVQLIGEEKNSVQQGRDGIPSYSCPTGMLAVRISDPGELYSGYGLEPEDIDEIAEYGVKPAQMEEIKANCTEDNWPAGYNDLNKRMDGRDILASMNVCLVARFGERCILAISPEANTHLPADWQSAETEYLIIGNSGITER